MHIFLAMRESIRRTCAPMAVLCAVGIAVVWVVLTPTLAYYWNPRVGIRPATERDQADSAAHLPPSLAGSSMHVLVSDSRLGEDVVGRVGTSRTGQGLIRTVRRGWPFITSEVRIASDWSARRYYVAPEWGVHRAAGIARPVPKYHGTVVWPGAVASVLCVAGAGLAVRFIAILVVAEIRARRVTCGACGHQQTFDPVAGERCSECGETIRRYRSRRARRRRGVTDPLAGPSDPGSPGGADASAATSPPSPA